MAYKNSNIYNLVLNFFNYDSEKTELWFKTKNPLLGDLSPEEMILIGREHKVVEFVITSLDENKREEEEKTKQIRAEEDYKKLYEQLQITSNGIQPNHT